MIKNIFKEKKINYSFMLFIVSVIVLNGYILVQSNFKQENKENIFRLHVVANSNSIDDQITKLKIETEVENYLKDIEYSKEDNVYDILEKNSNNILNISDNILKAEDKNYTSKLEIGKIYYDEKENVQYSMNKGVYNSARLVLGSGEGKNFWTIIFPNEDTITSIENLNTIIPGIDKIYNDNYIVNDKVEYDFKIKEILKKLINI